MPGKNSLRFLLPLLAALAIVFPGRVGAEELGRASWYGVGDGFQGRRTASGEIFDTNQLTAAHRTLPFGARVRVTNLDNGRSVVVRINDRGPFRAGRIIDLSHAAARELDMLRTGTARVRLDVLELPVAPSTRTIQVAAYSDSANAARMIERLRRAGLDPSTEAAANGVTRILLRGVAADDLDAILVTLRNLGISRPVVRTP